MLKLIKGIKRLSPSRPRKELGRKKTIPQRPVWK